MRMLEKIVYQDPQAVKRNSMLKTIKEETGKPLGILRENMAQIRKNILREEGLKEKNEGDLCKLVDILEDEDKHLLSRIDAKTGDIRGLKEYNFEIVKEFPHHTIDFDLWSEYSPELNIQEKDPMKVIEEKIPYCKGYTHKTFESVLELMKRNLNIKQIVNYFDEQRVREETEG